MPKQWIEVVALVVGILKSETSMVETRLVAWPGCGGG